MLANFMPTWHKLDSSGYIGDWHSRITNSFHHIPASDFKFCVSVHLVCVSEEARGLQSFKAGIMKGCKPPDIGAGG